MAKRQSDKIVTPSATFLELVRGEIRAAMRSLLQGETADAAGDAADDSPDDPDLASDDSEPESETVASDTPVAARRIRRRRGVAKIQYDLAVRKNAKTPDLVPSVQIVWLWLKGHPGAHTAREIEKATGLKRKTVESSIWKLRQLKLIAGKPIR